MKLSLVILFLGLINSKAATSTTINLDKEDRTYNTKKFKKAKIDYNLYCDSIISLQSDNKFKEALSVLDILMKVDKRDKYLINLQTNLETAQRKYNNEAFLKENAKRAEVKTTETGLQYKILKYTKGTPPLESSTVIVHYEGTLINGAIFDSSYDRGSPSEFPLNSVIKGWTEGLQLMSIGSTYKFYIPSDLAYGNKGVGNMIPPHTLLIFTVELIEIK